MRREYSTEMLQTLLHGTWEEKLRISRSMPPEDKMLVGFRLFEMECEEMRTSLRTEYPWVSGPLIDKFLRDRLDADRDRTCFNVPIFVNAGTAESRRYAERPVTIRTEEAYRSAKELLAVVECALKCLRHDEDRYHPKTFAALQEPYIDEIDRLRAALNTYSPIAQPATRVDSGRTTPVNGPV